MIVKENRQQGTWELYDRGRRFQILRKVAEAAYLEYFNRAIMPEPIRLEVEPPIPPPYAPPRVLSFQEFLGYLARHEWEQSGDFPAHE